MKTTYKEPCIKFQGLTVKIENVYKSLEISLNILKNSFVYGKWLF